jgi:non-specific serine/threonine protein kinase
MTPDRWQKVRELFERIRAGGPERDALLREACGDDAALRERLDEILRSDGKARAFLETLAPPREQVRPPAAPARYCPRCHLTHDPRERFCPGCGGVLVEDPRALIGTTLDGLYHVEELLGRGGMGVVYRARHALLEDPVAIKLLSGEVVDDPSRLRRFQQEGQAARRFRHPNAVAVYDLRVADNGKVYLVQEYVEGRTLRVELARRGRYSPGEALEVLGPAAGALDAAHRAGVVHRDIKPENVMVCPEPGGPPLVKVLDFGVAKLLMAAAPTAEMALTAPGAIVGTAHYMSPEQWAELPRDGDPEVDGRADVYSLGVVAYEMVCGQRPFDAETVAALRRQHVLAHPRPAHEVGEGVPQAFGRAIGRAMAKDRADRFATAGEFVGELRAALASPGAFEPTVLLSDVAAPTPPPAATLDGARRSGASAPNNLPRPVTSFIGREQQVGEVKRRLASTRLLTLMGPGGIGKTRLALEVAGEELGAYPDGVWIVELAAIADPALVPQAVASAVGVREEGERPILETLAARLGHRRALLVLDNCEHLVEACAHLADTLLRRSPDLGLLATSREALGIPGEAVWSVPSLSLPEAGASPRFDDLARCEAVRLFVERAALSRPDFALTQRGAATVAELCRRLEGIPLAIELAAARVKVLSVEQILARLDDRFRLLTGGSRTAQPRQQTLRAAIDWSHDLLTPDEQTLFRRLAAFAGGFTLEAAEQVASCELRVVSSEGSPDSDLTTYTSRSAQLATFLAEHDVLEGLARLVDKSLVVAEERGGEARYRMLETIRQYAVERLREAGEEGPLRDWHRDWHLAFAERAEPQLTGPDQGAWVARLAADHDNFAAALQWSATTGDWEAGLRLCCALGRYWSVHAHLSEGRSWLERVLAAVPDPRHPLRPRALFWAAHLARHQGDYAFARSRFEESLALCRELGDALGSAIALNELGNIACFTHDFDRAAACAGEAQRLFGESGDLRGASMAANLLGIIAAQQEDYDLAGHWYEQSLEISRRVGDKRNMATALNNVGRVALLRGDPRRGRALMAEGLAIARELGDRVTVADLTHALGRLAQESGEDAAALRLYEESLSMHRELDARQEVADVLASLASLALQRGGARRAARLAGAADAIRETAATALPSLEQDELERKLDSARQTLGGVQVERAREEGRAMSLDQAIAYALEEDENVDGR